MAIKRALISVHDKTGIVDFASELTRMDIEIIATRRTLKILKDDGICSVKHVSTVTGFPEILGGRVKTEHPKIIGGILALREKREHILELEGLEIETIDMVICNLCPFNKSYSQGVGMKSVLEHIDIGGSNLIRAAAKNFENVVVIVNPSRYDSILYELTKKRDVCSETRFILAIEAFRETAEYDLSIYNYLNSRLFRKEKRARKH